MTQLKLRPYQEESLRSIEDHLARGITRQLVHLPTAAGKTVIFASLISKLNRKTLVLAHSCELLDQAKEKITMICPKLDVGIVKEGSKEYDRPVVVCSIQSARQPETLAQLQKQGFTLCIYDEAQHSCSTSSKQVLRELGFLESTDKLLCGFSASPFRNDSKGLGEVFEKVVYHKSIKDLIALGYLCPPKGIRIKSDLDLSTVVTAEGDFVTTSLASVMNTPQMNDLVVNTFIEQASGRKAVCFSVTIAHAQNLAEAFRSRGIEAEAIHGGTPSDERKALLKRFKEGALSILTNCQILTEGWDCPEVDCVLMARPTQSKGLYIQSVGRGLRNFPNKKDCLILDFGSKSHSLCSTAILERDSEAEGAEQKQSSEGRLSEFAKSLPPSINKKLRAAIIEFDPLSDSFTWVKEENGFFLKATWDKVLKIIPNGEERYDVVFINGKTIQTVSKNLSFEYAFSSAEDFAKENRALFKVSDLEADWRSLPISEKQMKLFRSYRYRSGIQDLSRGQAAIIISSGVLNGKAARR